MGNPIDIIDTHGYKRIYFYHIRRVGGTSLNETFFQLKSSHPELVSANMRRSNCKEMLLDGIRYVGANRTLLELGDYFYGFSHIPSHALRLPSKTFTIAVFRDPIARIISHYRMVLDYERRGVKRYWMPLERQWLGTSFGDFCRRLPRERLHAQLFMFSQDFNVSEAVDVVNNCNCVFRTEDYPSGILRLSKALGLSLRMRHSHKIIRNVDIQDSEIDYLRDLVTPEYELLRLLAGDCL